MTAKSYTEEEIREIAERQNLVGYPHLALVREKLSVKAKSEPKFRFCNLKRLVVETETLKCAWAQVRANKGAPGVDGVTIEDIGRSEGGAEAFIAGIQKELHEKTYRASPVRGKRQVYDADLSSCFDTIPHDKLFLALRTRITDSGVLSLIRQWLKSNSVEPNGVQKNPKGKGTPQGGVISPLLSNIYLHWFETCAMLVAKATNPVIAEDAVFAFCIQSEFFDLFEVNRIFYEHGLKIIPSK